MVSVVPFGLLLGTIASQAGLTPGEIGLMSATVAPYLRAHSQAANHVALFFLADEVWALAMHRVERGLSLAYLFGLGLPLWLTWVSATVAGALLGNLVRDPSKMGFDFAFSAVFLSLLVAMWRGARPAVPWIASAVVAVIAAAVVTVVLATRTPLVLAAAARHRRRRPPAPPHGLRGYDAASSAASRT
ncbi:MAG: hypothetical protein GWN09_04290 [Gammaproteobacteria bacterium]|nr:hypothetical protein [Gammaproteobacteria bacterium]